MAKIKNKAAEVAFKILWALVAKKAHFEDNVIEPLQNTISNTQTKADALLKELKNNVFIAFKLKKGEAVTMQIIEDGKLKNIVLRGQDDLTWVEDKIWSLQCDVNSCTEDEVSTSGVFSFMVDSRPQREVLSATQRDLP